MESKRTIQTCSTKRDNSNLPTNATLPPKKTEALKISPLSSDRFLSINLQKKTRDWTHKKWTTLLLKRTLMKHLVTCLSSLYSNQKMDKISSLVPFSHANKNTLLSLRFKLLKLCLINQLLSRISGHQSKSLVIFLVHTLILCDSSIFGRAQQTITKVTFTLLITYSSVIMLTRVNIV